MKHFADLSDKYITIISYYLHTFLNVSTQTNPLEIRWFEGRYFIVSSCHRHARSNLLPAALHRQACVASIMG